MKTLRNQRGFTLIELIIVIIIIGILAAVALPKYAELRENARNATARGILGALRGSNSIVFAQAQLAATPYNYDMASVIAMANIAGIEAKDAGGTTYSVMFNAQTYTFGMYTAPSIPTTPGYISCVGVNPPITEDYTKW